MDWKIGSRDSRYQFMDTLLYFRTYTRSGTFGIGMEIVPRILLLSYTESIKISHPTLVYEDFSIFEISSPPRTKERKAANDDEWWSMMIRNSFHWIEKFICGFIKCALMREYIYIFWIYSSTSTRFGEKSLPRRIRVFIFRFFSIKDRWDYWIIYHRIRSIKFILNVIGIFKFNYFHLL